MIENEKTSSMYFGETTERPWYVGDDDLFIHPHWWTYDMDKVPYYHFQIIGVVIGIIGIVGVVGNLLVIVTFIKEKSLRTPPNLLIVNLAMSDMLFSAVNGFPLYTIASFQRRWNWGMRACILYAWFSAITGLTSIYTNAAIAVDRFFVICQPIQTMQRMSKTKAGIVIVVIWLWSNVISVLPTVGFGRYIPEGFQTSCTFDYISSEWDIKVFNIVLYVTAFLVPLSVILLCYWKIVKAVAKHEKDMTKMAEKMGAKDMRSGQNLRSDIKTAKVSATIIFFWFCTWIPYAAVSFVGSLGHVEHLTPYVTEIPVILAKASAMYNPIIYAVSHPKFREGMERTAPCLFVFCPAPKKTLRSRGSASAASQMSDVSDSGSVRHNAGTQMKNTKSTDTIHTVAGEIDSKNQTTAT